MACGNESCTVRSVPHASYYTCNIKYVQEEALSGTPRQHTQGHAQACAALSSSVAHPKPKPVASRRKRGWRQGNRGKSIPGIGPHLGARTRDQKPIRRRGTAAIRKQHPSCKSCVVPRSSRGAQTQLAIIRHSILG